MLVGIAPYGTVSTARLRDRVSVHIARGRAGGPSRCRAARAVDEADAWGVPSLGYRREVDEPGTQAASNAASPASPSAAPAATPAAPPAAPSGAPTPWPDDLELRDGDVVLRRWRTEDAAAVTVACQDPEISRWIPVIPLPYGLGDAVEFLAEAADEWRIGSSRAFAIVDAHDRLLGAVTLHGPEGHLAEIGYWLAPDARGRGVATRAVRLLTRHAFDVEPSLVRIGLRTLRGNDASAHVAERCGFTLEGTLRSLEPVHGALADVVVYSLLRGEAPAR